MNTKRPAIDRTPVPCEDARKILQLQDTTTSSSCLSTTVAEIAARPADPRDERALDCPNHEGERRQGYKAASSVWSGNSEAAPDGLDQRVGGHRERIAEGKSSHTSAPLPLDAFVSRGYGGVLSPSHHPAGWSEADAEGVSPTTI